MEMRTEDVALGGRHHVWVAKHHRSTDLKEWGWVGSGALGRNRVFLDVRIGGINKAVRF